ncbi:efflux RND transporter permease subunit [Gracilibacillus massiliensis]|uniref:efflux RND transporter permease subunit n=1 Tax=Gracilibacillus massiliensis TaxID=1564956 RepID=UPI00071E0128|nr:efflux RND transporter permease subunit [Gracilibacillus massiliensis]
MEELHSNSEIGRSNIQINFKSDSGDAGIQEIESIVHTIAASNPNIQDYMTGQYGTNQDYELYMDLSGEDMETITSFAEDVLEPRLENLAEVSDVAFEGLYQQEVSKSRIHRPIFFMTSLTTSAGMLPLAITTGSSGNYQVPMATVIISGLLFATFITLLLIPAVYRLFSKKERKIEEEYSDQKQEII